METVTISKKEYNMLLQRKRDLDLVIQAIETVQEKEEAGTDDVGSAVLDVLDMWL